MTSSVTDRFGNTFSTTDLILRDYHVATSGQTVFNLNISYPYGQNVLAVYVNGLRMVVGTDFAETNVNTVTFTEGLVAGDQVEIFAGMDIGTALDWASSSTMMFLQAGTGAVARSVQAVLRERISLKDFGAVGNGAANDTEAWLAFKTACLAAGAVGEIPSGTYMIDAFSFSGNSGLKLRGATNNPNLSQVGGVAQTTLKLRSAASTFVTIDGVYDLDVQDIHFDGGQYADTVVSFPGTSTVTDCTFERCAFDGATPSTGRTFYIVGAIQVDNCRFRYCNVGQVLAGNGSVIAGRLIENTNTNAFNIWFEHSRFEDADYMFVFGAGSCSFYRCDFFRAATRFFYVSSITQPFAIIEPYNESDTVPFFIQAGTAGAVSSYPITIERPVLNGDTDIIANCQQPLRIIGGHVGGDVDVTPMATYGTQYVTIKDVGFNIGHGITGTGYPSKALVENWTINQVPQVHSIAAKLGIGVVPTFRLEAYEGVNLVTRLRLGGDGTATKEAMNLAVDSATGTLAFEEGSGGLSKATLDKTGKLSAANKVYPGTDAGALQTAAGIYAGSGAPNNSNGSNGDFYFRSDGTAAGNTVVYHKEGGSWVALTT